MFARWVCCVQWSDRNLWNETGLKAAVALVIITILLLLHRKHMGREVLWSGHVSPYSFMQSKKVLKHVFPQRMSLQNLDTMLLGS